MAKKGTTGAKRPGTEAAEGGTGKATPAGRPSAVIDTRVIYCGDNLEQLAKLPDKCVDLIYIDPPFNSNRNYEVFWGETKERRAFEDRHASTQAYIDYMRLHCVQLASTLHGKGHSVHVSVYRGVDSIFVSWLSRRITELMFKSATTNHN